MSDSRRPEPVTASRDASSHFREVIVGTDFGRGGLAAIDLSRRLTVPGGRLTLVHVLLAGDEVAWWAREDEQLAAQARFLWLLDRERRLTIGAAAHPPDLAVRTQMVVAGSARRGLAHVAGRIGADAVIVGTRHRRRFAGRRSDPLRRGGWELLEAAPPHVTPADRPGRPAQPWRPAR